MNDTSPPPLDGGRILVVDGNELNRTLLLRPLRRQGFAVESAEDGPRAIGMLASSHFDLLLLESELPGMSGFQVLETLKREDVLRHVPVIMIMPSDDMAGAVRGLELGADDYLSRPFEPILLRVRVDSSLAKKRLRDRELLHARSVQRELEIGHGIQAGFLPDSLVQPPQWEVAAHFRPARQVTGDLYDVFPVAGGESIALLAADVCETGVGAAVFMAVFRTLFRTIAEGNPERKRAAGGADHLLETVSRANDYIARTHGRANMSATVFLAFLDPVGGRLLYVNAGHEEPAVLHRDGRLERLSPTGPAVGLLPGLPFHVGETILQPGSLLLAFTDGIPHARGAAGEAYSEERLLGHLVQADAGVEILLATIEADIESHTSGADPIDDMTLLAIRRERST